MSLLSHSHRSTRFVAAMNAPIAAPVAPLLLSLAIGVGPALAETWLGRTIAVTPDVYTAGTPAPTPLGAGEELFSKAHDAATAGESARAFELATAALLADPDHAGARRVFGYEAVDGQWMTPYQARQQKRGQVWDARFGWVRATDLPRYERGERLAGRRWISAETDAAARTAIDDGWVVRTDRFAVQSNHSLEAAARLAAELESFFQVWRTRFAGYRLRDRETRALFDGDRAARRRARPMRVFYHRDKASYVEHLRRRQPRIAETLGIYFDDRREAHFFHSDDPGEAELLRATLYHEAAHQLFAENGPGRPGAGRQANFWLIEGVACYFEMLSPVPGEARFTLGDPAQGRLPSAVVRGPVIPLAELAGLGQSDLQRLPDLAAVYAQSAGIVAMLLHGERAAPEALVATLRAVYARDDRIDELAERVGRSWDALNADYREFLANLSQ